MNCLKLKNKSLFKSEPIFRLNMHKHSDINKIQAQIVSPSVSLNSVRIHCVIARLCNVM